MKAPCAAALATLLLASSMAAADAPLMRFERTELQMGVQFRIVLYAPDEKAAAEAMTAAFARVRELNGILSDYDPESELSRLGKSSPHEKAVPVSDDLWRVLSQAQAISAKSEGTFDITLGPLTKLWRKSRKEKKLPADDELATARAAAGYQFVELDEKQKAVRLLKPGMRLDAGGIGKGYAAQEALAVLKQRGVTRALTAAAGDMAAGDPPPGEEGWKIGIAGLDPAAPPVRTAILANQAISTSGDAFQYIEIDGRRYSHILDPRTGLGLTARSSVTVVAPTGGLSDPLAKVATILGPEKGFAIIESFGGRALMIRLDEKGAPEIVTSKGWRDKEP